MAHAGYPSQTRTLSWEVRDWNVERREGVEGEEVDLN